MDNERKDGGKRGFRDLIVWQRAMALVIEVYRVTGQWPGEEQFGLTAPVR